MGKSSSALSVGGRSVARGRATARSARKGQEARKSILKTSSEVNSRGNLPKGVFKNHRKRFMFSLCNVAFPPFPNKLS